jgi:hypothetical protein
VAAAVLVAWSVQPWPGRQNDGAAAVPSVTVTVTTSPRPVYKGFADMKKKHPPKGKVATVPPLMMWLSDAPRKGGLLLCESGPEGSSCASFPPLAGKEFARTQARGKDVWFGIAKDGVHGVTAVTKDGRTLPASLARDVGAGLGLWAIQYPPRTDVLRLVIADADGRTVQRIAV